MPYSTSLRRLSAWIGVHWFVFVALFGLLLIAISGLIGSFYGVPALFRDDPEWTANGFLARLAIGSVRLGQTACVLFIGLSCAVALFLDEWREGSSAPPPSLWDTLKILAPPVALLGVLPLLAFAVPNESILYTPSVGDFGFALLGQLIGYFWVTLVVCVTHFTATRLGFSRLFGLLGFSATFLTIVLLWPKIVPVVAIVAVFAAVALLYFALCLVRFEYRILAIVVPTALIALGSARDYRHKLAGIERADGKDYYANPVEFQKQTPPDQSTSGLIPPKTALDGWLKTVQRGVPGSAKPKMVLVATTGGAYRSAYWTALVLDHLKRESAKPGSPLAHFADHIRIITGASGGMVAGAYFVALASKPATAAKGIIEQLDEDIIEVQRNKGRFGNSWPVRSDSLSPVVQQLAQRDLFQILLPISWAEDRGAVLEQQWQTLDIPFSDLYAAEASGQLPHLVFSPMVVETGQQLVISNLAWGHVRETFQRGGYSEIAQFFELFPGSQRSFKVATAVRMSASFPYISPVAELPTKPPLRIVDAGYYDNYGISLLTSWLQDPEIREWVSANTSGVIILEIRAFPLPGVIRSGGAVQKKKGTEQAECKQIEAEAIEERTRWDKSMHWLTTPPQGSEAARTQAMLFRNNQAIKSTATDYKSAGGSEFVHAFIFENRAKGAYNWNMSSQELKCMKYFLKGILEDPSPDSEYNKLVALWQKK